jgi:hypothetical protein
MNVMKTSCDKGRRRVMLVKVLPEVWMVRCERVWVHG